jgi:alginate O-acetyltransferase complex protein AlgJ
MTRSQKTLLGLLLITLAFPLPALMVLRGLAPAGAWADWPLNRTLRGVTLPEQSISFDASTWFAGQYQRSITAWVNQNFAFREAAIRCYDQLLWSLFGKSYMANESIIQGKDGWLFEVGYLQDYNYLGPLLNDAEVRRFAERLVQVQQRLSAYGVSFVVLVTPSKATFLPQYVPERYKTNLSHKPRRNYERVVEQLKQNGIPVIDGPLITRAAAKELPGDIFPKAGVHWSHPTAFFTAEEFLRVSETVFRRPLARLHQDNVTIDDQPSSPDNDLALLLNLAVNPSGRYMHSTISLATGSPRRSGHLTIVGGSFVHQLVDIWEETKAWETIAHYYYYKVSLFRYPGNHSLPIDETKIDWEHDFYASDVVALEINESSFGWNHPNAFIAGLLSSARPPSIVVSYPSESWHDEETRDQQKWRWSAGDARLEFTNSAAHPVSITCDVSLISNLVPRAIILRAPDGRALWEGTVGASQLTRIPHVRFELPPGRSFLAFTTDHQGTPPSPNDSRLLAFAVYDLKWTEDSPPPSAPASDKTPPPVTDIQSSFPQDCWYALEHDKDDSWRWASGSARISILNRSGERCSIVTFSLASFGPDRLVTVRDATGNACWQGRITMHDRTKVQFECVIPPGRSEFSLKTDGLPLSPGGADTRKLAIAVYNFDLQAKEGR